MTLSGRIDRLLQESTHEALFRCLECGKTVRMLTSEPEKLGGLVCLGCEIVMARYPSVRRDH